MAGPRRASRGAMRQHPSFRCNRRHGILTTG